jgi:hypothetical protein
MSLFKRIFTTAGPAAPAGSNSQPASQFPTSSTSANSVSPLAQQNASRRELLRLVLRDTLNRTGIPTSWVGADLLAATSRGREPGIHVRLLMKHWDPRLMLHGIAFENAFKKRVLTLDPLADRWLLGISWQFALPDESNCPAMPHPGVWTSSVPTAASVAAAATSAAAEVGMKSADPADLLGGSIVISGPAHAPDASAARSVPAAAAAAATAAAASSRAEAKADLERLFAVRDQDAQRHAQPPAPMFAATEPGRLHNLPSPNPYAETAADEVPSFAKTDVFRRPTDPASRAK